MPSKIVDYSSSIIGRFHKISAAYSEIAILMHFGPTVKNK